MISVTDHAGVGSCDLIDTARGGQEAAHAPRLDESAEASAGPPVTNRYVMQRIRSAVTTLRSTWARQRAARSEQRSLERDLAEHRSEAERQELYAILSRHTAEQAAPIERILTRRPLPGGLELTAPSAARVVWFRVDRALPAAAELGAPWIVQVGTCFAGTIGSSR